MEGQRARSIQCCRAEHMVRVYSVLLCIEFLHTKLMKKWMGELNKLIKWKLNYDMTWPKFSFNQKKFSEFFSMGKCFFIVTKAMKKHPSLFDIFHVIDRLNSLFLMHLTSNPCNYHTSTLTCISFPIGNRQPSLGL